MNLQKFYAAKYDTRFLMYDPNIPKTRVSAKLPEGFLTEHYLCLVMNKAPIGGGGKYYYGRIHEIVLFDKTEIGTFQQPRQADPIDFECLMTDKLLDLYPFWKKDLNIILDSALSSDPCFARQGISFIRIDKSDFYAFKEAVNNNSLERFPVHGVLQYQGHYWRMELPTSMRPLLADQKDHSLGYEDQVEVEEEYYEEMRGLSDYLLSHNPMPVLPSISGTVKNQITMTECGCVFNAIGSSYAFAFLDEKTLCCDRCQTVLIGDVCSLCVEKDRDNRVIACPKCSSTGIGQIFFGISGQVNICALCDHRFPLLGCQQ